jgi:outer membrane protein OmpA-like peptidoglycan-associated protein
MQVQKNRFRLWVNEYKLFDVPMAIADGAQMNQIFFRVFESSYSNDQVGVYVSNIKVAKGSPDTRSKLLTEGRFSTTGILFDVNAAVVKPGSYGVIKEVADVLKADPSLKINIIGHTDADGGEADNQRLSRQRSEAVKQVLVNTFNIDPARITTDGKGELAPVSNNNTREGKAQNRRVEFIKQ